MTRGSRCCTARDAESGGWACGLEFGVWMGLWSERTRLIREVAQLQL